MKKKKFKYCLILILIVLPLLSFSQRWKFQRMEATAGIGSSHFFGDIGGTADENNLLGLKDISVKYTRPNLNFGGRYRITEELNAKANLIFGYLEASDENSRNESRNYAFSSSVFEFSGQVEYNIIPEKRPRTYSVMSLRDGLRTFDRTLNTYVFAGLGGIYFNPKPLADLEDSGRFSDDKHFGFIIPFGVGVKYPLNSKLHVGFELGARWSATDYIDGLTTQYSEYNDVYYFTLLNVILKIDTSKRGAFNF
ncbi:MAG: DUF6089 family protein [Bacteroidota bacterium]